MELSRAYTEIHRLWKETQAQRKIFEAVANKVESEMGIVCQILQSFAKPIKYEYVNGFRYVADNFSPLGVRLVRFKPDSEKSKRLMEMTEQELETLVNSYSPETLEILEIQRNKIINAVYVKVKLKEFQQI